MRPVENTRTGEPHERQPRGAQALNKILYNELVAINQYFLHSKMFKDWGLTELAEHEYHESIDEMKHADALVERILFLEGIPNLQDLGQLRIGESPKEMLECDLQLEHIAHADLVATIECCEEKDFVSRDLAKDILEAEEEHVDWLETQLSSSSVLGSRTIFKLQ